MGFRSKKSLTVLILIVGIIALLLNYHKNIIQYYNTRILLEEGLENRLVVHRVDHFKKLQNILEAGISSVEIDVIFRMSNSGNFFEVAHDEAVATKVPLDSSLNILRSYKNSKIWLDVKNINDDNIADLTYELTRLDSLYGLKQKAIIESGSASPKLKEISYGRFHLSFYLPKGAILELMQKDDTAGLRTEAEKISRLISENGQSAVSFDLVLYPFVKNYLEPEIADGIVYHVWDSVKLWEWDAIGRLKKTDYFKDPKVATILYRYW